MIYHVIIMYNGNGPTEQNRMLYQAKIEKHLEEFVSISSVWPIFLFKTTILILVAKKGKDTDV